MARRSCGSGASVFRLQLRADLCAQIFLAVESAIIHSSTTHHWSRLVGKRVDVRLMANPIVSDGLRLHVIVGGNDFHARSEKFSPVNREDCRR